MRGLKKSVFIYLGGRSGDGEGFCLQFGESTDSALMLVFIFTGEVSILNAALRLESAF